MKKKTLVAWLGPMLCAWPSWYRAWHVAEEYACQQFFKCLEDHLIREYSGYFVPFCFVKIFCKMVMNQRHIMNMKEKCRAPDSVDKWNKYECRRPENAVSRLTCDFCSWSIVQCLIVCYVEVHSFEVHSFTNCLSFVAWFSTFKCFTLYAFDSTFPRCFRASCLHLCLIARVFKSTLLISFGNSYSTMDIWARIANLQHQAASVLKSPW